MKIITHNGIFHADEIMAIALLTLVFKDEVVSFERTRDSNIIELGRVNPGIYLIDVGLYYNTGLNNFDHHQDTNLPSSNVMILDKLHNNKDIDIDTWSGLLDTFEMISDWDTNKNNIHKTWKESGFGNFENISTLIADFNRDPKDEQLQSIQFTKALMFCVNILENKISSIQQETEAWKIYSEKEMLAEHTAIFNEYCSVWKNNEELYYAIQPNPQGWALMSFSSEDFPITDPDHKDLIFAHRSRFISIYKTKEAAISIALKQIAV